MTTTSTLHGPGRCTPEFPTDVVPYRGDRDWFLTYAGSDGGMHYAGDRYEHPRDGFVPGVGLVAGAFYALPEKLRGDRPGHYSSAQRAADAARWINAQRNDTLPSLGRCPICSQPY